MRVGLPLHPGQYAGWGSQQSVASPTNFSPSPSPRWRTPQFSLSPEYVNGDPHGGFNPNLAFPHCPPARGLSPFTADIKMPYGGSPTYSILPALRRGPLAFVPNHDARSVFGGMTGDAYMDELIATGSLASASCPGFFTQTAGMESQQETSGGGMDSQQQTDNYEEQAEPNVEEEGHAGGGEPATKGKKKKPKAPKGDKPAPEPRIKWSSKEDECLAEAWKTVSIDPITDANQNVDHYWKRVKTSYDERRLVDPDFTMINMEHSEKAMANH